ncbi:hypothetical protein G6F31_020050 [Rhizopus arrhizus]|nr:hypothetical protein G6F31_020050 [Rhizopus arrhizus]
MPGMTCGTMTRRITVNWVAPKDNAAASVAGLIRCSDAHTEITMNGTSTCVSAMATPRLLYIRSTGVEISPMPIKALLISPVEPNSSAQPRVRTTTEIKSGPSTTIRNSPFHGLAMRDST